MKILGLVMALLGLMLMKWGKEGEGLVGAIVFVFGLLALAFAAFLLFFEDGEGLAGFLPFLN